MPAVLIRLNPFNAYMRTAFKLVEFLIRALPFELWITTLTIPPIITTPCQPLTTCKTHSPKAK